jgi:hypothetical protein
MQKGQTLDAFTLNLIQGSIFRLHIKAFVLRVITLISCQAQGILDLQQVTTQKINAILPMLILRVRIF